MRIILCALLCFSCSLFRSEAAPSLEASSTAAQLPQEPPPEGPWAGLLEPPSAESSASTVETLPPSKLPAPAPCASEPMGKSRPRQAQAAA